MEFKDKLIELRKGKSVSQEELADQIGVTRQTVSKWELGQSKPDMDKLIALSKYYNISIEELTKEEKIEVSEPLGNGRVKERKQRKGLMYTLVIVLVISIVGLIYNVNLQKKKEGTNQKGIFASISNLFKGSGMSDVLQMQQNSQQQFRQQMEEQQEKSRSEFDKRSFNSKFAHYEGSWRKLHVDTLIDNVVTNNKTNKERLVSVEFNGTETSDVSQIKNMKKSIKDYPAEYEISIEYDEDGYVYKILIEQI